MLEARAVVAASELTGLCCPEITTSHGMWVDIYINCLIVHHRGEYQFAVLIVLTYTVTILLSNVADII
jgi:hypothetical protein